MKDTSFYEQILGLESPWQVERVNLDVEAQQVDLWLRHRGGVRWACPECEVLEHTRRVKATCELLQIHWDSYMRMMRRAVERGQERKEEAVVEYLAVDEKAFRRGHSYLTVVCNAREGTVEYVAENRDWESLCGYYRQLKCASAMNKHGSSDPRKQAVGDVLNRRIWTHDGIPQSEF